MFDRGGRRYERLWIAGLVARDCRSVRDTALAIGQSALVPLVDVTYNDQVDNAQLLRLGELLSEVVPQAVDCLDEPFTGPLAPGDLELRFHPKSTLDVGDLNLVIEVRTKRFESRLHDAQRRADTIRDRLATLSVGPVGVWLMLIDGAWSQD